MSSQNLNLRLNAIHLVGAACKQAVMGKQALSQSHILRLVNHCLRCTGVIHRNDQLQILWRRLVLATTTFAFLLRWYFLRVGGSFSRFSILGSKGQGRREPQQIRIYNRSV